MINTTNTNCDPNKFIDTLRDKLKAKNDAAICRALGVQPPVISKIRARKIPIGATLLVRIHESTRLPVWEIRAWAHSVPAEVA